MLIAIIILALISVIFNIFTIVILIGICNHLLQAQVRANQSVDAIIYEVRKRLQNHPES